MASPVDQEVLLSPSRNSGSTTSSSRVLRVGFKFGVVKSGRFKLLLGREAFGPTPVN